MNFCVDGGFAQKVFVWAILLCLGDCVQGRIVRFLVRRVFCMVERVEIFAVSSSSSSSSDGGENGNTTQMTRVESTSLRRRPLKLPASRRREDNDINSV